MMNTGPSEYEICSRWPLHCAVWRDDCTALKRLLNGCELEGLDPRGRTPLHLAVSLNRVDCAKELLMAKANPLAENRHKWSVLNEAICTGNPQLIGLVLRHRDQCQQQMRTKDIPLMLERLQKAPDYYMEMKWEFSSWVPFVSRMCPSDTCRIWKKGTTVRVDTTLVGFEKMSWQRGQQTLIFEATPSGHRVCDINHEDKTVWEKEFLTAEPDPVVTMMNQEMGVLHRLSAPVISTFVNTDSIVFQRQKSGIWGFRSDKTEEIDGYQAKVFSTTGLEVVTQTRVEHLPVAEKHKHKSINPLQDFLGAAQDHSQNMGAIEAPPKATPLPAAKLTMQEYFTPPKDKSEYDAISRPPEVNTRVQKLKAIVALAEKFPLSLQDQIMPIIDLMAMNTPHFGKVKDFINMQMPSGFPVKLEIPLFHVISAKVSFTNVNGHTTPVPHVSLSSIRKRVGPPPILTPTSSSALPVGGVKRRHGQAASTSQDKSFGDTPTQEESLAGGGYSEESEMIEICTISDECFAIPPGYRKLQGGGRGTMDQEEELLQMAIQQSLLEQKEELTLQEALEDKSVKNHLQANSGLSLHVGSGALTPVGSSGLSSSSGPPSSVPSSSIPPLEWTNHQTTEDEELEMVLAMSKAMADREREERWRQAQEDEELEMVLKLSLQEK